MLRHTITFPMTGSFPTTADESGRRGRGPAPRDPRRFRIALIVAIAADALQLAALPAFAGGWGSPFAAVLDVIVAIVMVRLLGWHWALLPTLVAELIPFVDLVPTWTLAVLVVGRARR